ncbi:glycosyltransferase family 2 protein [Polynucleobacter paneuropaeus]|jgi:glycosyltransferase involved in cell wall biosynthesis|nr:glycosyltransferase family 2 protein [Polynucleobacter paneuropaeus]
MVNITLGILSYNRPEFLFEAVESALNQTVKPEKIVIFDNGSKSSVKESVASYLVRGVQWNGIEKNIYPKYLYEKALRECDTDYIMFLHDDDRLHPNFLEEQFSALEKNSHLAGLSCNAELIDIQGRVLGKTISSYRNQDEPVQIYRHAGQAALRYASNSCIPFSPTIYRAKIVREIELRGGFGKCGDAVFLCDIADHGGIGYNTLPLYDCRIHPTQDSASFPLDDVQKLEDYFFSLAAFDRSDKALLDQLLIQRHTVRNVKRAMQAIRKGEFGDLLDLYLDSRFSTWAFLKELTARGVGYKSRYQ